MVNIVEYNPSTRSKLSFWIFSDALKIGLAQPYLALVMQNGSVWNIQSNDQFKTIEKNLLIQLPKSRDYHAFSTKNGVLNFVKDDISSNIIQYQNSKNNQNHNTVQKSSVQFKPKINAEFFETSRSLSDLKRRTGLLQ